MGIKTRRTGYVTNLITDYAINWLNHRDKSKPFFLIYQQKAPRRNWMPEEKYYHLFDSTLSPCLPIILMITVLEPVQPMNNKCRWLGTWTLRMILNYFLIYQTLQRGWQLWVSCYNRLTPNEKKKWEAAYRSSNEAFFQGA